MNDEAAIALYAGRLETLVEPVDISAIMGTVALPAIDQRPRRRRLVAAASAVLVAAVVVVAVLLAGNGREDGVDTVGPAPLPVATSTIPEGWWTVTFTAMHDAQIVPDFVTVFVWIEFPDGALEPRWEVLYQRVAVVEAQPELVGADGVRRSRVALVVPPEAGQLIAAAGESGESGASLAVSAGPERPTLVSGSDPSSFPGYPTFPGNMDGESQVEFEAPTGASTSLQTPPVDDPDVLAPDPTTPEGWVTVTAGVLHAEETLPSAVDIWVWIVSDQTPPVYEPHWQRLSASVAFTDLQLERVLPSGTRLSRVTFTVPPEAAQLISTADVTAVSNPEGPIEPCSWTPDSPCPGEPEFQGEQTEHPDAEIIGEIPASCCGVSEDIDDWMPVYAPDHDGTVYVANAFIFGFGYGDVGEAVDDTGTVVGYWIAGIGFVEREDFTPDLDWRAAVLAAHVDDEPDNVERIIERIEERGGLQPVQSAPELPGVWPPS